MGYGQQALLGVLIFGLGAAHYGLLVNAAFRGISDPVWDARVLPILASMAIWPVGSMIYLLAK